MDLFQRPQLILIRMMYLFMILIAGFEVGLSNVVFNVEHKFSGHDQRSLSALKAHDLRRHGRFLSSIDIPIGGNGLPYKSGLYFAKIGIGSPSHDYYVQVDSGSDILWVNCAGCDSCPTKTDLGIDLRLYDPNGSGTGTVVGCKQSFCIAVNGGVLSGCQSGIPCPYSVVYGDGSSTSGYYVEDTVQFDRVSGNFQTSSMNGTVIFGCGAKQSGGLGSSTDALDGILGFGQANSSMLSQLANAGRVKKFFAHCLDTVQGGGIFAIGQVVQPNVTTTPLLADQAHYNVVMTAVEVGGDVLQLPSDEFDTSSSSGTIIDSGTTLAYLPSEVYTPMINKILAQQPDLKFNTQQQQFTCFQYSGIIDDGFPKVTFHFSGSLTMVVFPHEYLFPSDGEWCIGWQNSGTQSNGRKITLLGDMVLSNKLVIYDLENQNIGWTDYNCSSSIKVKDSDTGAVYSLGANNISSAADSIISNISLLLTLVVFILYAV